ncbi:hypothetical protein HYV69_01050 [Candidatus Uhrbacteria bacterium]|nr:hypothetical protein [Candidatus Uhrbacteria bacterium]
MLNQFAKVANLVNERKGKNGQYKNAGDFSGGCVDDFFGRVRIDNDTE